LKQANEDLQQRYRLAATGLDFEKLLRKVAKYYSTDPADLKTAGKESTLTKTRTVLCYLAVGKLTISCADVVRKLRISPATVSRADSRGTSLPNLKQIQKELLGSG
jgi:chromosomal replication initiation ATPase DnaA